ncbi:MAG TPA: hypothetical protein VK524_25975, partial [Polyangiaceae bacterium]|nr:hypothetical protein [Polyangiaceae bacterium]
EETALGYMQNYVLMPFALVQSQQGDHQTAAATADAAIAQFKALGSTGLNLAVAYEMRARVALIAQDQSAFEEYAALSLAQLQDSTKRLFEAKYERLTRPARAAGGDRSNEGAPLVEFISALEKSHTTSDRAQSCLEALTHHSGAKSAILYLNQGGGLVCSARLGAAPNDAHLQQRVEDYFLSESTEHDVTRSILGPVAVPATSGEWRGANGERYVPVLLSHRTPEGMALIGVAVLVVEPGASFLYPGRFAAEFSRSALAAHDVVPAWI